MDHRDHVGLIRSAVSDAPGTWADIGAGTGAFTLALADLLGPGGKVIAVDRDAGALRSNAEAVGRRFPETRLVTAVADLTGPLSLPTLDGLLAANSLHFVPHDRQPTAVASLARHLRPDGRFVIVEYDAEAGNRWVPYPILSTAWPRLAVAAGLEAPIEIGRVPSRFLGAIYSAVARRPSAPTNRSTSDASL
jgi:ubiquinone/menaquinone biosynthesis C-methylase UbiE